MLARLQQAITLGLIALATAWALYFFRAGHPIRATLGALLIVLGYVLFLAFEFILLAFIQEREPTPRPTVRQLFGAWWGEVTTAPRVFCWRQPFFAGAEPDLLSNASGRRGIVFVHGFFCNRALWNPWMSRLRAEGVPFIAVSLEPVFGSISDYVATTGTVLFAAGQLSQRITIPLQIEPGAQPTKSFGVVLSNIRGGAILGGFANAEVRIVDTK